MTTRQYFLVGCGVAIVLALAGFFLFAKRAVAPAVSQTNNSTSTSSGPSSNSASNIPEPDLNRPFTPSASLPANIQSESKKEVASVVAQLKTNSGLISYWLQLAIYRKGSGDFVGAEEVWLYVVARWPADPVAYNNLADLYGNYTHQYDKAVEYWKKLIALRLPSEQSSLSISAYINLAGLQSVRFKDPSAARATLSAGLKAFPSSADLQHALASLGM